MIFLDTKSLFLKRVFSYLFLLVVFVCSILVARIIWQDDKLNAPVNPQNKQLFTKAVLDNWPSYVVKPLAQVLTLASIDVNADNNLMVEVADRYIKNRPLDPRGWLWASQFLFRGDDVVGATQRLKVAHGLSQNNAAMLMAVFNRYLELGDIDSGTKVAHDIALARPKSFRQLFYLLTRLSDDYDRLVDVAIPKTASLQKGYKLDYYSQALNDAVRAKNFPLATAVWSKTPSEIKVNSTSSIKYVNYLMRLQKSKVIQSVWKEIYNQELRVNQISNSDIELPISKDSPCWAMRETTGVKWSSDDRAFSGLASLMVEFGFDENVRLHNLSCIAIVEPGSSYMLKGQWSGEDITTLSGPFIDVVIPGVRGVLGKSNSEVGSWPWQEFKIEFKVPETVSVVSLRIRRDKTDFLDSKISGRVWIDNFRLEKKVVSVEPEITLNVGTKF